MYSDQAIPDELRARLKATGFPDSVTDPIINRGADYDIPPALGDRWAGRWTDAEIARLAALTDDARIDHVFGALGNELFAPGTALERATHAARAAANPDLQAAGAAALAVHDVLVNFNKPIYQRNVTPYGVRYKRLGEIDIETTRGIVEVTTQASAAGKVAQLRRLLAPERNHFAGIVAVSHANAPKPVLLYMPALPSTTSRPARALIAGGAHGVYNTLTGLEAAIRGL